MTEATKHPCMFKRGASQVAPVVKKPPANAGDGIRDADLIPGSERPLEKEMATHFRILAWKIP